MRLCFATNDGTLVRTEIQMYLTANGDRAKKSVMSLLFLADEESSIETRKAEFKS